MPRATSPYGEVLTIPVEGVHAMRALGWDVEDDEATPAEADAKVTVDSTDSKPEPDAEPDTAPEDEPEPEADSEPEPEEKPARTSRAKK